MIIEIEIPDTLPEGRRSSFKKELLTVCLKRQQPKLNLITHLRGMKVTENKAKK